MSCDVGEVTESLENEQSSFASPTSQALNLSSRPCYSFEKGQHRGKWFAESLSKSCSLSNF